MVFFDIITTLKFLFFSWNIIMQSWPRLWSQFYVLFFRFRHSNKKMRPKITEKNCITMLIKNLLVVLFSSFHLLLMGGTFQRFTWFLRNITNRQSIINSELLYKYLCTRISESVRASSCAIDFQTESVLVLNKKWMWIGIISLLFNAKTLSVGKSITLDRP